MMDVLVGLPDDGPERRSEYRQGVLRFAAAKILIVERPDSEAPFAHAGSVDFVLSEDEPGCIPDELLEKLEGEYRTYTFFVQDWRSSLKIAAVSLEFSWS